MLINGFAIDLRMSGTNMAQIYLWNIFAKAVEPPLLPDGHELS